jgi:lysine-specific demethylase 3
MRNLPNGFMAISPAKNFGNGNVGSCSGSHVDVKVGGGGFNGVNTARRCFRSKNIEPMPVGKLQVGFVVCLLFELCFESFVFEFSIDWSL